MFRPLSLAIVALLGFHGLQAQTGTLIPTEEREALVAIYQKNNGPAWIRRNGWLGPPGTEQNWQGVKASGELEYLLGRLPGGGHVVELDLTGNNVTGVLAAEIGNLPELRVLRLGTGPIVIGNNREFNVIGLPEEIGRLKKLEILKINGSRVQPLPAGLVQLESLRDLDISSNLLVSLPAGLEQLASLEVLRVRGNRLVELPVGLGNMPRLRTLDVANNLLDSLPASIGGLASLETLDASFNRIRSLPAEIGRLTNLTSLNLDQNGLVELPPEIGRLRSLQTLSLQLNLLTQLPAEIGRLAALKSLMLQRNGLVSLPSEISSLAALEVLVATDNSLQGPVEPGLGKLASLKRLYLSRNRLSGPIPVSLAELANLEELALDVNRISGGIPSEISRLGRLKTLNLSQNLLSGSIPAAIGSLAASLDLSDNLLSGSIPEAVGLMTTSLNLSHNQLSGPLPSNFGAGGLRSFDISHNRLSGILPDTITTYWNVARVNVAGNQFSGRIPERLLLMPDFLYWPSNFRWNALETDDPVLESFLSQAQGEPVLATQTLAPREIEVVRKGAGAVELRWKPAALQSIGGWYEIWFSPDPKGPYAFLGKTDDKATTSKSFSGVDPSSYFAMRTVTVAHESNANQVSSDLSAPASVSDPLAAYTFLPVVPAGNGSFAGLALANPNPEPDTVFLEAFDSEGNLLSPEGPVQVDLATGGQQARLTTDLFPGGKPASIRLRTSAGPAASTFQLGGAGQLDGAAPSQRPLSHFFFTRALSGPAVFRGRSAETLFSVANPNASAVKVRMRLFSAPMDGTWKPVTPTLAAEVVRDIKPHGFLLQTLPGLFGVAGPVSGGHVEVETLDGSGVLGSEWLSFADASLVGLNGVAPTLAREFFSPQAAVSTGVFTDLKIINLGGGERTVDIQFVTNAGPRFRTRLVMQPWQVLEGSLKEIMQTGDEEIAGTLQVGSWPGLLCDIIVGEASSLRFASAAPVHAQKLREAVFGHAVQNGRIFTGLAVHNPNPFDSRVTLELHAPDGRIVASATHTLRNQSRLSSLLSELLPLEGEVNGGYIVIRSNNPVIAQEFFGDYAGTFLSAVQPVITRPY